MPIIKSILDNDLYKFTMQAAVPAEHVPVRYVFSNRRPEGKFNESFMKAFNYELECMAELKSKDEEMEWFQKTCPFLSEQYIEFLRNYRYNPKTVNARLVDGNLELDVNGEWRREILWEVSLMSVISELYFTHCETDWSHNKELKAKQAFNKGDQLTKAGCIFADFGTRRRRSYKMQNLVVDTFKQFPNFVGTSNVYLAYKHGVKPIGTMAHEWIMGISALKSLRHANEYSLDIWRKSYNGDLGIALTDTFGSDAFFESFNKELAKLYDGVRHDSGDALEFSEKVITHYKKIGIDPATKTIVFSDGLNVEKAIEIQNNLKDRIKISFGIGTHFTNDYLNNDGDDSKSLNMVIKLWECDGIPVVKLSDIETKQIGDPDALRVANWTFFNTPLDQNK